MGFVGIQIMILFLYCSEKNLTIIPTLPGIK